MNWDQPMCDRCWIERDPSRTPVRLRVPDYEQCAWCGQGTRSGIYVRADPRELPHPKADVRED